MAETLPGLLAERATRTPTGVALRQKRLGIWHEISWQAHLEAVQRVAAACAALGLRPGEVVALIGEHRPQWLQTELAVQAAGGVVAPVPPDSTPAQLTELLRQSGARFAVVEGQEQADKLLEARGQLPALEAVVYWDPRGMRAYTDPWLRPLADLSPQPPSLKGKGEHGSSTITNPTRPSPRRGGAGGGVGEEGLEERYPQDFSAMLAALTPDAVAEIIFTPGTDGAPRAVRLTHANLLAAARAVVDGEKLDEHSGFVSFAPNAWIGDRAFATAGALLAGYTVNLPEEPETVPSDIQEIGPRLVVAPPLAWQRFEAVARARAASAGWPRRVVVRAMLSAAGRAAERRAAGELVSLGLRLQALLAEALICRPVRDHLGLLRTRQAYSAGAPLPESTARFFRALGLPLKQLYVLTAAGGPVAVGDHHGARPLPGIELDVAADGEVLVRGSGVAHAFAGEDAPVTGPDGWLRTGDLGHVRADGAIALVDRVGHVTRLADGTPVVPAEIEQRVTASPYVRHAVALAEGRPYVAVLLAIDGPAVSDWAEDHGLTITTYRELSQHPDVRELVHAAVQDANAGVPEALRIQRFAILDRELSADDGELTRLRTVRRAVVRDRWSALVDTMYGVRAGSGEGPDVVAVEQIEAGQLVSSSAGRLTADG